MTKSSQKTASRIHRHKRLRSKIAGTATTPRLSVYRSNKFVYAQLIDDEVGKTLVPGEKLDRGAGLSGESCIMETSPEPFTILKCEDLDLLVGHQASPLNSYSTYWYPGN